MHGGSQPPGTDLEVIDVGAGADPGGVPAVPAPGGFRRRPAVAAAVVVAVLAGFLLGRARQPQVVSPTGDEHGVGWLCDGRLTAVLRFEGLPDARVDVELPLDPTSDRLLPVAGDTNWVITGARTGYQSFLASHGLLELVVAGVRVAGAPTRLPARAETVDVRSPPHDVTVDVLPCSGSQ